MTSRANTTNEPYDPDGVDPFWATPDGVALLAAMRKKPADTLAKAARGEHITPAEYDAFVAENGQL